MKNISILIDYERVLMGTGTRYVITKKNLEKEQVQENAIMLLKFVFENLLEWTPEMIQTYLNTNLIKWLHLEHAINSLHFPPELDKKKDLFYVASALYPEKIHYAKREFTLFAYQKYLDHELLKFPKNFFSEAEGMENLKICFLYIVEQRLFDLNSRERYLYFSDRKQAMAFLKNAFLLKPARTYFEDAIDLFHASLPSHEKDELFFKYAKFLRESTEIKEELQNDNPNKRKKHKAQK